MVHILQYSSWSIVISNCVTIKVCKIVREIPEGKWRAFYTGSKIERKSSFQGEQTMKRLFLFVLILVLSLTACMPAQLTLVPAETLAAQTMAAMPRTDTPGPPTEALAPTATIDRNTPTPSINLAAPGAYCLPTNTERISGLVTRVLDAETIEVATGNTTYRVRYIGLDAPNIAPVLENGAPRRPFLPTRCWSAAGAWF